MLQKNALSKPARLRQLLTEPATGIMTTGVMVPGAFNAIGAKLVEQAGFPLVYISGAGIANGVVGVPDIGLLTADEMAQLAGYIARAVDIPAIADADDGYGDAWQVYRTVQRYEREGIAGLHLEDQQAPKRCGHLDGKQLIPVEVMQAKLRAAVAARQNPDLLLIARTDANAVEGLDAAIARAKAYMAAGADMIFAEALTTEAEFAQFRAAMPGVPLLANMTEFGKTPLFTQAQFASWGYQLVIYPLTAFRQCLTTMRQVYDTLGQTGTQASLMPQMTTRQQLYDLLNYPAYTQTGQDWLKP
jgi:methylisocitrate lyase